MNNSSLAEDGAYWRTKCARLEQDNGRLEAEVERVKAERDALKRVALVAQSIADHPEMSIDPIVNLLRGALCAARKAGEESR